jgi:hypothetical protein
MSAVNSDSIYFQGFFDGKTNWNLGEDIVIAQKLLAIRSKQRENEREQEH